MVETLVSARKALEPTSYPRLQDFLGTLQSFEACLRFQPALILPLTASRQLRRPLTIRYRDSSVDSNIPGTSLDQGGSSRVHRRLNPPRGGRKHSWECRRSRVHRRLKPPRGGRKHSWECSALPSSGGRGHSCDSHATDRDPLRGRDPLRHWILARVHSQGGNCG